MPTYITQTEWDEYKEIINNFHDDAFQQEIILRKITQGGYNEHGEDVETTFTDVTLLGLFQYNDYRSWPTTKNTSAGEIDKQNQLLYLNIKWLEDNGFANTNGFLDFDPGRDRFIINGLVFKALGESHTAQAQGEPLLQFIILKREEEITGEDIY